MVYGIPADSCAMRATIASVGQRTLPIQISWISAGDIALLIGILAKHPLNAVERRVDGETFDRAPFLARQSGVRTALTITTSLGFFGVAGGGVILNMSLYWFVLVWFGLVGLLGFQIFIMCAVLVIFPVLSKVVKK